MLALDQLSETMETISDAIDNLKHNVADAQQSLIDKYSATQAEKRAREFKESKKLLIEKTTSPTKANNSYSGKDENEELIYETPIVIH